MGIIYQRKALVQWYTNMVGHRKKGIKSLAMNVSTYLKRKENERVEELETKLNTMSNMDSHANSAYIEISKIKEELFDIYTRRGKGSKILSRVKWWEEGEKSPRYFHNLEKTRGKDKVWHRIKNKHGDLVFDPYEIQKCQVDFYKELYTANNAMNEDSKTDILKHLDKVLDEGSKGKLDEDISMAEVIHALKKQKTNKSPGPDGIPVEFYKMYWHTVGEELLNVFHSGLDNRRLAHSQYLVVIKLLYKKRPREDIKNWRPVCLLNADYKLLSKVLAERIKSVLPKIIHSDQKGGVDGRYIGENIWLIEDILYEMENENSDAVILMLDMEKAFDRVEWGWLFKVLAYFNIGERFISWLMTIYQHAQCSILTNGIQSEYFPISRGIRQGDALSASLFVVQAEPFAQLIRTDTKIQGFKIDNGYGTTHIKACQYVDDTVTVLKNKSMIKHFFHLIERYGSVSRAKLNVSKTVGLVSHPDLIDNTLGIQMTIGPERLLGVEIKSKEYWSKKICDVDINWKEWFSHNFVNILIPRKCKDFNWKIFRGQLNTELRLKKMKYSNGICKICEDAEENTDHLISKCPEVNVMWKCIKDVIHNCITSEYAITDFHKIAYMDEKLKDAALINMLLTICRWTIWKRRNINKYDGKHLKQIESIALLKSEIKKHVLVLTQRNLSARHTRKCLAEMLYS